MHEHVPMYRVRLVRTGHVHYDQVQHANDAVRILRRILEDKDRESFVAIALDSQTTPIGVHIVSTGSLSEAIVHPRELFKFAILTSAASLIIGHNHPSGDPTPSPVDHLLTDRLVQAGRLLGIPILDHIIIGHDSYTSLKEENLNQFE